MKSLSKKIYIITLFLVQIHFSFSQNSFTSQETDFSGENPAFVSVLGGNVLCQPVRTSYGYIAAGDGKQVLGFSRLGKLLWQRHAPGRLKPFITEGPADLIYGATTDSRLFMMNSSGLVLWTAQPEFNIEEAPLCGKDGRVFIRGKNMLSCYGLKGVQRWKMQTEIQDCSIPLSALNDGSLLVFLEKSENGKSVALRITPFGEKKEEIVFAGKVTQVFQCAQGVVLAFTDGSAGLCSAEKSGAVSKWIFQPQLHKVPRIAAFNRKIALIYPGYIYLLDEKTGSTSAEFPSDIQEIIYAEQTAQGLAVCSLQGGACYGEDGSIIWKTKFGREKKWNFVFAADSGYIIFCMQNWALEAFQARLNLSGKKRNVFEEKKAAPYTYENPGLKSDDFLGQAISGNLAAQMQEAFSTGEFGGHEEKWNSLLKSELDCLRADWTKTPASRREIPYFRRNIAYCQTLIDLESESGIYFGALPQLIKNADDPFLLIRLVHSAGKTAFDPEGNMLSALEIVIKTKATRNDKQLLREIADSTYEICRFMGRPSFFKKGKEILKYMMYPQFDKETREYAVKTLDKIIESEM
ncbi:hypothetical protein [Treponema sp.]|uniref:hypothetical protein n=1 Tax=Treponema sp. TaxID=166 RepID=UPI003F103332